MSFPSCPNVINNLPKQIPPKHQAWLVSLVNSLQHLRKKWRIHHKLFQEIEVLPNSFSEASVTLIPKSDEDFTRKENYLWPISLINIDINILNKILTNWIQLCIKIIICHDWMALMSGLQGWSSIWKLFSVIYHM